MARFTWLGPALALAIAACAATSTPATAAAPRTLTFQGVLTAPSGLPKPNGAYPLTLRLYDAPTAGNLVWTETNKIVTVAGDHGAFSTSLGAPTPFGALPFDKPLYLQVQVTGEAPMTPRLPLQSAPYALGLALPYTAQVSNAPAALSIINLGTGISVLGQTDSGTGVEGQSNSGYGVLGTSSTSTGVRGESSAYPGVWGKTTTNSGVVGESITGNGVYGVSDTDGSGHGENGVYGASHVEKKAGVYGENDAVNGYGVFGREMAGSGAGLRGQADSGIGVQGLSSTGIGMLGSSGTNTGVYGQSAFYPGVWGFTPTNSGVVGQSTTGNGVYGVSDSDGKGVGENGVYGKSNVPGKGGVYGENASSGGYGAYGNATGFNGIGVYGTAPGSSGSRGVFGTAASGYGVYGMATNSDGVGVYGESGSGSSGSLGTFFGGTLSWYPSDGGFGSELTGFSVGVLGSGSGQSIGVLGFGSPFAGGFVGNVLVTGEILYSHRPVAPPLGPDSPATAVVSRAVESREALDVCSGNVTLDDNGEALVSAPGSESWATDVRYSLTPIGAPAPGLYVAVKVHEGCFRIAGGAPGMEVSWMISGVRKTR